MLRFDLSRLLFIASITVLVLGFTFLTGLAAGVQRGPAFQFVRGILESVTLVWGERDVLVGLRPIHHLQPARHAGAGVTVNDKPEQAHQLVDRKSTRLNSSH